MPDRRHSKRQSYLRCFYQAIERGVYQEVDNSHETWCENLESTLQLIWRQESRHRQTNPSQSHALNWCTEASRSDPCSWSPQLEAVSGKRLCSEPVLPTRAKEKRRSLRGCKNNRRQPSARALVQDKISTRTNIAHNALVLFLLEDLLQLLQVRGPGAYVHRDEAL